MILTEIVLALKGVYYALRIGQHAQRSTEIVSDQYEADKGQASKIMVNAISNGRVGFGLETIYRIQNTSTMRIQNVHVSKIGSAKLSRLFKSTLEEVSFSGWSKSEAREIPAGCFYDYPIRCPHSQGTPMYTYRVNFTCVNGHRFSLTENGLASR